MITTNRKWTEFYEKLLIEGFSTLWTIEGNNRRNGLAFDLVCILTNNGPTIFQVWNGTGGFNIFTRTDEELR